MTTGPIVTPSDTRLPLSVPELRGNEWAYVKECLDTGWVSSAGPFVDRFEREVAAYVGRGRAVATISGTAALHTALYAVGVEPGDEVIVSNLTFVAPANAVRYCGAQPVLMDADPATWQMDVAKLEAFLITRCETRNGVCVNRRTGRRVRAVLPVHVLGLPCEIDRIVDVARRWGLRIVEDACEAMGVRWDGRHVGTFGDAGALSFNGNKIVTTGGGGMVLTESADVERRARYFSTQARDDAAEYVHREIGQNYRLSNLAAAVGVAQLEQLEAFIARKRTIAARYHEAFEQLAGVLPMPRLARARATYWLYTIVLERATLAERQAVIARLQEAGIEARSLWHTIHDLPPYSDCEAFEIDHSVALYERAISLPSSAGLRDADIVRVIDEVGRCVGAQ
jgi:perosamine synthetase